MEGIDATVSDQYFSELLSYPLERLAKEPELLRVCVSAVGQHEMSVRTLLHPPPASCTHIRASALPAP